ETHAHSFLFRGKEVIENFVRAILWQPHSEIAHRKFSDVSFIGARSDNDTSFCRWKFFHGVECVNDQVQQHLLNLNKSSLHSRYVGVELSRDNTFAVQYVGADEPHGI